ncbi:MAG: hypothetical protein DRI98_12875, partial [Bacteroidetes bacterium]
MPDLIRHPVNLWIPAFAGMTAFGYSIVTKINMMLRLLKDKRKSLIRPIDSQGAVLLTVVFVLIIIGLVGSAIYSLTFTSTYTQMNAQNATRAHYIAESGVRIVAAEYNQAAEANKNTTLESLHNETLTLPDNSQIDLRIYPYWFYVNSAYTSGNNTISLRMPGGIPITDIEDPGSSIVTIPGSGRLKLKGKTRRADITASSRVGNIITFSLGSDKFPYDIDPDEEIFLGYKDNATSSQSINQDGTLLLVSTNRVAQFIPSGKGSFRIHNEDNDRMDYTYREKVTSGGNIQLNGIRSQDPANPSVLPFSVDSTSEIFFGKNLATVAFTTLGQGNFAGQKTVVTYSDVGLDGGFNIGRESISFKDDIEDFNPDLGLPMNSPGGNDPIEVDETAREINLGGGLNDGYGSVWYGGDSDTANCIDGRCNLGKGFRAYFEFISNLQDDSVDSTLYGDGFTFAIISGVWDGAEYRNDKYDTGGPLGEYLGYAGPGLPAGDQTGLEPPKIALELDTYPNPGAGSICGSNSRVDDVDSANYPEGANHIALDYWGAGSAAEMPGSFHAISSTSYLADGGGFLRVGSAEGIVSDGDPEDWSSSQGTISFWFKRDTIRYGNNTNYGDRMWGQNANMEMRFSIGGGSNLVLDWGGNDSLTVSNHPFTVADKWYFLAIAWDESTNTLSFYAGDEGNTPGLIIQSSSIPTHPDYWGGGISTVGITENLFMNSSGGSLTKNYIVNGKGSDLRYFNVERTLAQIQSDYDTRLDGSESGLQAYFPLESDLANAAAAVPAAVTIGTTSWSDEVPAAFDCSSDIATRDDNRHGAGGGTTQPMNSLNTDRFSLNAGDDGYYQVAKVGTYNWMEDGNCYGVRLEVIRPLIASGDGNYDYQIKAWVESVDADCTGLNANYKDVRATYTGTDPQIELTIKNGNIPLELDPTVHADLKNILFGFTQATGGATQDITLKNLDMRFIKTYPV